MAVIDQRDTELVPVDIGRLTIAEFHATGTHVGDKAVLRCRSVAIGVEHLGRDTHLILEIAFKLVEREVLVDILHVGSALVAGVVRLLLVVGVGRVSLWIVDALVTGKDRFLFVVEIRTTEIVVVVAGRVVAPSLDDTVVGDHATVDDGVEPLLIGTILPLLAIVQTVETDILQVARATTGGEGIGLRGLYRNLTPLGVGERTGAIDGHATLIELLTVVEHILTHLTQVEIEVTSIVGGRALLTGIDKRVEQPELNILDVGLLEVGGLEFAHHTTPFRLWLTQRSVGIQVVRQVVGTTFLGIICQIEHRQRRGGTVIGALLTVWIELLHIDLTHVVVRQLVEVALDMAGGERRTATGEDRIDVIPGQQGTVVTAADAFVISRLLEETGHTRQCPCLRIADVDIVLRVLEVINIRGIVLRTAGRAGNQLGKLTRETDVRGFLHMEEGYLVEHRREPLRLLLPVDVQPPYRVAQRLPAHRHLRGECLFGEVHHRTPQLETL